MYLSALVDYSLSQQSSSILYGYRLLPITIDDIAESTPENPHFCVPRTSHLKDGFMDVTYADFSIAIDRSTWWLKDLLGKSTTVETLAYPGPLDLRYLILTVAASKVGYNVSENSILGFTFLHLMVRVISTFILTGGTGSLGSYLLDALASAPLVAKIYCLDRKADAEYLQVKINAERGLTTPWGTRCWD